MNHKITEIFFSPNGSTKKISNSFCTYAGWTATDKIDLLNQKTLEKQLFTSEEIVIVSMPVFAGRIPEIMSKQLHHIKGTNTPAIALVVYGNRDYDDALLELTDILKANGFVLVGAAALVAQHSIFPAVASGRPDKKDMDAIKDFSQTCKKAIENFSGTKNILVKGNVPYREPKAIPLKPSATKECNACGICVNICPTKAISPETPRKTDKERCISCVACISACPQNARTFNGVMYSLASKDFVKNNSERKEPAFFYTE